MPNILIVDDEEDTRLLLCDALVRRGYQAHAVESGQACLEWLRDNDADVVVTDFQMPGLSGLQLCETLRAKHPEVVPMVLTGMGTYDVAISAVRAGVYDYITKPVKVDALVIAIERALDHIKVAREVTRLRTAVNHATPIPSLIGTSSTMRELTAMVRRIADSDATVLITGESGTGKELVARALHDLSPRKDEPFVAINCGAVPANLLESELFGHVKGAFTDARASRNGLFVQAGAGTIFLDEIGEMPLDMQVKLLRVLQERMLRPVGGDTEQAFHARVVTATNRDLEDELEAGRFREDLFYRINVVPLPVPPLRDRGSDILLLATTFLERIAKRSNKPVSELSPEAKRMLMSYDWPGNVRELENCMERAVAMSAGMPIETTHLPTKIQQYEPTRIELSSAVPAEMITLDEMERRYVRQVLSSLNGNKTHAARALGIDRRSLYRRLETPPPANERPNGGR